MSFLEDSNLRPSDYGTDALSSELKKHVLTDGLEPPVLNV